MEFKMITQQTLPQVLDLWDYCFEKKEEAFFQWYFEQYCLKNNLVLGGFSESDGHLMNMLHLNPYKVQLRGREEAMPYIVGVATAPEDRGSHLMAPLLEMAFQVLLNEHFRFAFLMPAFAGIYLPYGFAFCYYKHLYDLPLQTFSGWNGDQGVTLKRVPLEGGYFASVYTAWQGKYHGMPVRTEFQWQKLLAVHQLEGVQAAVTLQENEITGYMFYLVKDEVFTIQELLSLNDSAKKALLGFAAGHMSSAEKLCWEAAADDLTYLDFRDAEVSGRLKPFMMARCLDARGALQDLKPSLDWPEGECNLLLTDSFLQRNNHLLNLSFGREGFKVASTTAAEDVVMDMGAFTQLYFGAFTLEELADAGKAKIKQMDKAYFLQALFPKRVNYINEYF